MTGDQAKKRPNEPHRGGGLRLRVHERSRLRDCLRTFRDSDVERYLAAGVWRDRSYVDDVLNRVARTPDKPAVVTQLAAGTEHTTTYGELGAAITTIALRLVRLGIRPGDVVPIQLTNGWLGPAVALAAMRVGAVPCPIPIIYREREVEFVLRHSRAPVFVTCSHFRGFEHGRMGVRLAAGIPTLRYVFVAGAADAGPHDLEAQLLAAADLDGLGPEDLDALRPSADDVAMLIFTSGTTGTPKAVLHTHNTAWAGHTKVHLDRLALTADDVCFMASTIGHTTGFIDGTLTPLSLGQTVVYQEQWSAPRMVEAIEGHGVSWTLSATTFALDLLRDVDLDLRVSRFRAFACGGAAIPTELAQAMSAKFGAALLPLWGCTETGIATMHRSTTPVDELGASDGRVLPWADVRIVDEAGHDVPAGESGVLLVRSPAILAGYLHQPELTDRAVDADGWFDTGDLGRVVAEDAIRFVGRSKDIIVRGGQNIPPVEVENALIGHPHVARVAVVGYPDDRLGERACAVVVASGAFDFADMVAHLEGYGMAKQFWPERLVVVDELPATPSGKIQKYLVRERLVAGDYDRAERRQPDSSLAG